MSLSWFLIVVVLCGAFMHACWNAVIKSGRDSMLDTALVMFASSLLAVPFLLWVGLPDPESWRWIGTALAIHLVLYFALSRTYRLIDLGLAYPIMRGMSPMLVALMSAATVGEVPSATLWSGVVLISAGVLVLGAPQFVQLARRIAGRQHDATLAPAGLAWAALCACCIAATAIVGAIGVRVSGNVPAYLLTMVCLDGLPFACIVLWFLCTEALAAGCAGRGMCHWGLRLGALGGHAGPGCGHCRVARDIGNICGPVGLLRAQGTFWLEQGGRHRRSTGRGICVAQLSVQTKRNNQTMGWIREAAFGVVRTGVATMRLSDFLGNAL